MSHTAKREITWFSAIVTVMILGVIGMLLYAITDTADAQKAAYLQALKIAADAKQPAIPIHGTWFIFAAALLVATASTLVGALVGLIFGIPKTVVPATTTAGGGQALTTTTEYQGNSNFEQISDWLTKILVGAGLVQIGELPEAFGTIGSVLQDKNWLGSGGGLVGPAIIITYLICGFFIAYLWSRIYMERALENPRAEVTTRTDTTTTITPAPTVPPQA